MPLIKTPFHLYTHTQTHTRTHTDIHTQTHITTYTRTPYLCNDSADKLEVVQMVGIDVGEIIYGVRHSIT